MMRWPVRENGFVNEANRPKRRAPSPVSREVMSPAGVLQC